MSIDAISDFANSFAQNLADFSFFFALGIFAGMAFPIALLCKRSLQRTGYFLARRERKSHRAIHYLVLLGCMTTPWEALLLGMQHDGSHLTSVHAAVMIAASVGTMLHLLRRWRLYAGRDSIE